MSPFVGPSAPQDFDSMNSAGEPDGKLPAVQIVDTAEAMSKVVDALNGLPTAPPSLYIDLEGENLSRHGTISLLQIFVRPTHFTYLIDVFTLRDVAFVTQGACGYHLKNILESSAIPKVIFDVRTDSDALFSHFQINLAGIQDLQLMELATRTFSRKCVNGLAKCMERDTLMTSTEKLDWQMTKDRGRKLFAPECGGRYQVFNVRPLPPEIMTYCAQDVQFLPRLWSYYSGKLTAPWEARVGEATRDRVVLSQSANFNGKGRHMALAPSGWT